MTFTVLMCDSLRSEQLSSETVCVCVCVRVCEIKIQKLSTSVDISRLTGGESDRVQQLRTV